MRKVIALGAFLVASLFVFAGGYIDGQSDSGGGGGGSSSIAGYATNAGTAAFASNAAASTYADIAGYVTNAGTAAFASNAAASTYAEIAGYATNAGTAAFASNAAASTYAEIAGYATNAMTNNGTGYTVGNMTTTGRLVSTVDQMSVNPQDLEFAQAGWVRSLAMQGQEWFYTATRTNAGFAPTGNTVRLSTEVPAGAITNNIAISAASTGQYVAAGISTSTFSALRSPVTFEIYAALSGGNSGRAVKLHPEVYYRYVGSTNLLGDWEVDGQTWTETTPTRRMMTVAFPEPTITGQVEVIGRVKITDYTGAPTNLAIYGGTIYPSHMDIASVSAGGDPADWADFTASTNVDLGVFNMAQKLTSWHYWGSESSNESWRIGVLTSNLVIQVRIDGVWTNAIEFTRPAP